MPSKSRPYGSRARPRAPRFRSGGVAAGRRADGPGPNSRRSRCFFDSFPNGTSSGMPKVAPSVASASSTSCRSPALHGAIAPSRSASAGSGTMRSGSKSHVAPRPWHPGHAPCGELNENARGVISGTLSPQVTHARRRENSRSPPASVLMTTMSSASPSARFDRVGEPPLDPRTDDQAIDDDLDRVIAAAIQPDVVLEGAQLAVDAGFREAARLERPPAPSGTRPCARGRWARAR